MNSARNTVHGSNLMSENTFTPGPTPKTVRARMGIS